ncbi:hypothetical protein BT63DRAFT_477946 [Microthyrium microscopicum]|uniref:Uncharacterized protein n=1 Tax=Microthyrium microscopicum TaxID=703497 RepID=A0A6A6UKQ8_9PEZI|nr:hypothetical protein BT63DRAFT_477946 [Microthyrium microscopicum]
MVFRDMFLSRDEQMIARNAADSVHNRYGNNISKFMHRNQDGVYPIQGGLSGDLLEDLFDFTRALLREKRRLADELSSRDRTIKEAKQKIDQLNTDIRNADAIQKKHDSETRKAKKDHDKQVSDMSQEHSAIVSSMKSNHESTRMKMDANHKSTIVTKDRDHKNEVDNLISQLLVNQKDNDYWPDDKLKLQFRELQRQVEELTAAQHSELLIRHGQRLGNELDPTGFLGRVEGGRSRFFLRGRIWSILVEHFFSAPFGFGAFGTGEAKRQVFTIHETFQNLLDGNNTPTANGSATDLSAYSRETTANTWRAALFQRINSRISNKNSSGYFGIRRLSEKNRSDASEKIMRFLSGVVQLSGGNLRETLREEVDHITALAFQIALQFGIHPARLQLIIPQPDQSVQIGDEYQDCEDGNTNKGSIVTVDLVVLPGLEKVGDGRLDLNSKRAIVPCEVYPVL